MLGPNAFEGVAAEGAIWYDMICRKLIALTGLATQLALAYAIHKSFIFVRVPLTAAVTPKVVHVLRSWGWNIGKRTPRS